MKNKPTQKIKNIQKTGAVKTQKKATGFWNNKTHLIYLFLALGLTALVFSGSLGNGFVNWDDEPNLLENPNIALLNGYYIKHIFTDPVIGNYNPLPILTFAIEHHFVGFKPFLYHLDNLLLHLICVFFVYRIFIALGFSAMAALIGAMLFGFHPMRVESVAWVTERKDVLFGVFYLSALFLYIRNKTFEKPRLTYTVAIAFLFVLSLFSKIQAVSLPLTMLMIDFYLDKKLSWKILLNKLPYFLFSIAFGLAGIYFLAEQKSLQVMPAYSIVDRVLVGFYSFLLYLVKFVAPYRMSPLYPYDSQLSTDFYFAPLGIIALAVLGFIAWRKKWNWLLVGLGISTVNVMFLLQIVGAGQALFADRFTYIPYLGLIFMVIYGIDYLRMNAPARLPLAYSAAGIYIIAFAYLSWNQIGIWKNGGTLWTHVLEYYPKAATPWQNRARYYRDNKQFDFAMADLTSALTLSTDRGTTFNSRGKLYFDNNKYKEAIEDYTSSLAYKAGSAETYINRGAAYAALGEYEKGIEDINKGLGLNPDQKIKKNAYLNLGVIYFRTDQYEKANESYDKVIEVDHRGNLWYEKALCQRGLGKEQMALEYLNKAIEIGPPNGLYYNERIKVYLTLGNKENAKADIIMAEKLGVKVDDKMKAAAN